MRDFLEYKNSSEQRIKELEDRCEQMEKVFSAKVNGMLGWIEEIGKETESIRKETDELRVESFRRWQEQWSSSEGVPLAPRPFMDT